MEENRTEAPSAATTAVVLAGGGALGAYEAGVLSYVFGELARELGGAARPNVFAGTSVGALNCGALAAYADDPGEAVRRLARYWRSVTMDHVLRFGHRELATLLWLVVGRGERPRARLLSRPRRGMHAPVAGLFDTGPLHEQMKTLIPWDRLQRNLARGTVRGIALCATEVCTGLSIIFYQTSPGVEYRVGADPAKEARQVRIDVEHAMASAAIPFLFPSVQIDGVCYTDGGIRQNTPLNPALRLGAERVLVVSVSQDPLVDARLARSGCRRNAYPGALFLVGRMAKVLLAQSLDYELSRVELYNRLIEGGVQAYGPDFLLNLNRILSPFRNSHYRPVRTCHIRPSRDLHSLAVDCLKRAPEELTLPGASGKLASAVVRSPAVAESELLTYVMFTPTYARELLALGERDARASRDRLVRFFADE